MSLHPQATYPIPEETQRVARAAFPRGNIYMQVADRLGTIYHDAQFAALYPTRGQPAEAPARRFRRKFSFKAISGMISLCEPQ